MHYLLSNFHLYLYTDTVTIGPRKTKVKVAVSKVKSVKALTNNIKPTRAKSSPPKVPPKPAGERGKRLPY